MKLPFGKKKTDAKPAKKAKKESSPSNNLPGSGSYIAICFAAIALIVYGCFGVLFVLQQQKDHTANTAQLQAGTEALAARLSDRMQHLRLALENLANNPALSQTLYNGKAATIAAKEIAIQKQIPDAWQIRLFLPQHSEPDTKQEPHMSYASLDILRQAEKTKKTTLAEAHQFGSKNQHIALATPVFMPGDETKKVVGVIHAAFKLDKISAAINAVTHYGGQVEVRQVIQSKSLTLAKNSGATTSTATIGAKIPIPGTIWEATYLEPTTTIDQITLITFASIPTAGLFLIGIIMLIQAKRLKQALKNDQGAIVKMVEAAFKGGAIINPGSATADCYSTMELVAHIGTQASRKRRAGASGGSSSPSSEGETSDPTDLTSSNNLIVEADHGLNAEPVSIARSGAEVKLPSSIFLAYDIRGIVGDTLTRDIVYELGRAIGSEAYDQGQQTVIMARDGRLSSEGLSAALCQGLQDSGRDVLDIGMVPVPVLYFATHSLETNSGVMLTASHNPADYNGLKIVINGEALSGEAIQRLRQRVETGDLLQGEGTHQTEDITPDYIARITQDVQPARPLKVVVDCGNGVAGTLAPILLKELGCDVIELYCDIDGNFPNHHPDPGKPENLEDLIQQVKRQKADLGVAFDGDGDRLGVVDSGGNIIWPDRLLMLFATDVLSRQPGGDIIYDVKSSRSLAGHILSHGGRPLMWKTGHSFMKAKLKETGALLAGEMSGHIFFKERWYGFDDALYACARLLEILSIDMRSSKEIFAELPQQACTPELFMDMPDGDHHELVKKIINLAHFDKDAKLITIDGLRAEFDSGWGLVRPSNTIPAITFRFEATNKTELHEIQEEFRQLLKKIDPDLELPF